VLSRRTAIVRKAKGFPVNIAYISNLLSGIGIAEQLNKMAKDEKQAEEKAASKAEDDKRDGADEKRQVESNRQSGPPDGCNATLARAFGGEEDEPDFVEDEDHITDLDAKVDQLISNKSKRTIEDTNADDEYDSDAPLAKRKKVLVISQQPLRPSKLKRTTRQQIGSRLCN
jgi:hypothetical protein